MMEKEITVDGLTLLIGLATQFGGIVWQVSRFKSQLSEVAKKVDKLEADVKEDRRLMAPIVHSFSVVMNGVQAQLDRLEIEIKELRREFKDGLKTKMDA